jgi:hypothetical protein
MKTSGLFLSFPIASMHAGASRNDNKPGMYAKSTLRAAVVVSIIEKSDKSITTADANIRLPSLLNAQSSPAIILGLFFIAANRTCEAS